MIKRLTKNCVFVRLRLFAFLGSLVFFFSSTALLAETRSLKPVDSQKSKKEPWIALVKWQIEELEKALGQSPGKEDSSARYDARRHALLLAQSGDLKASEKLLYAHSQKEQHQDFTLMVFLANIYFGQAKYERAKDFLARAGELRFGSPVTDLKNTPDPIVISLRNRIGDILIEQGLYTKAQALLMDTFAILKTYFDNVVSYRNNPWQDFLPKRDIRNDHNTRNLVAIYMLLGKLYKTLNRFADAEAMLLRGLELQSRFDDYYELNRNLSEVYRIQGRYPECESLISSRNPLAEELHDLTPFPYISFLHDLAQLKHEQGLYQEAESGFEKAISFGEIEMGNGHYLLAPLLISRSKLYHDQGRLDQAETLLDRALSKQIEAFDSEHPVICETLKHLSIVYRSQGRFNDSERALTLAIDILARKFGQNFPHIALYLNELGLLKFRCGLLNEAEWLMGRAISLLVDSSLTETIQMAECLQTIAEIRIAQNNLQEANSLLSRKLKIQKTLLTGNHRDILSTQKNIDSLKSHTSIKKRWLGIW
jgi:tetratricopeptide (TPR) repeat protein